MQYAHLKIEQKWQKFWLKNRTFSIDLTTFPKRKFYILDMFPYPSGKGLHVGHLRGYVATDVLSRMKKMQKFAVLHPIGFDSFGLPAEQYALKTQNDPATFTDHNIANFICQLQSLGFAYDYQRIIKTSDPRYYRWTQWIFQQMFQAKLAYKDQVAVNYCPQLNTVLANEEVIETETGLMVSERGNHPVYRRYTEQWLLDIVRFAPSLLSQIPNLDWPFAIKQAQTNWIGALHGFEYEAKLKTGNNKVALHKISIFTTFLNDWNAASFLFYHYENKTLDNLLDVKTRLKLKQLRKDLAYQPIKQIDYQSNDFSQMHVLKSKLKFWNPLLKKYLPIYFTNVIDVNLPNQNQLINCHHQDKFLPLIKHFQLLSQSDLSYLKQSLNVKSTLNNDDFIQKHPRLKLISRTYYRLRNWVFSRQRYWGEPFPLTYQQSQIKLLPESQLPLKLPSFKTGNFQAKELTPLANFKVWKDKNYDLNVMPQWAGSCWYFLAYLLRKPNGDFWPLNSKTAQQLLNHWMPVDLYVGGQEHAVSHLLYARFWNHFLVQNCQIYNHLEPFKKLVNQGIILGPDNKKMSKSRGNVVDPMEYLVSHGADAMRLYIQFIGPFSAKIAWQENNLDAMRKWLARVYKLFIHHQNFWIDDENSELDYVMHHTIKSVTTCFENYQFNVAIAKLMTFINVCYRNRRLPKKYGKIFLQLLHPICPHLTEEIWRLWKNRSLLINSKWPIFDPQYLKLTNTTFVLQINGKSKKIFNLPFNTKQNQVLKYCLKHFPQIVPIEYQKIIFIPDKVINFVKKK